MKSATLTLVVLLASCGLRPKQAAGSLSWVAIGPATNIDSQPIRVGVVTALLVVGAALFEWDARRDVAGEKIDMVVNSEFRVEPGEYVREVCSKNTLFCMGPYRSYLVRKMGVYDEHHYRLAISYVDKIPEGAMVREVKSMGSAEQAAMKDAVEQTEFTCDLGCSDPSIGPDRGRTEVDR